MFAISTTMSSTSQNSYLIGKTLTSSFVDFTRLVGDVCRLLAAEGSTRDCRLLMLGDSASSTGLVRDGGGAARMTGEGGS